MTLAKIYKGPRSKIDEKPFEEGSIYFTTDTQEILADVPGETKHQVYSAEQDNLVEITKDEVDVIFEKYPFTYQGEGGSGSANIDKDELYAYVVKKMLGDPAAIFQGASATSEGLAGLVPPVPEVLS